VLFLDPNTGSLQVGSSGSYFSGALPSDRRRDTREQRPMTAVHSIACRSQSQDSPSWQDHGRVTVALAIPVSTLQLPR
jgi:hypothetical protein